MSLKSLGFIVGMLLAAVLAAGTTAQPLVVADVAALKAELHRKNQVVLELRRRNKRIRMLARHAIRRDPDVNTAIRAASVTYGIPVWQMRRIAFCESRMNPRAKNPGSSASGLFQFLDSTWRAYPYGAAGLSVWDPYVNALQAAYVVKHDGGWRQWECKL